MFLLNWKGDSTQDLTWGNIEFKEVFTSKRIKVDWTVFGGKMQTVIVTVTLVSVWMRYVGQLSGMSSFSNIFRYF